MSYMVVSCACLGLLPHKGVRKFLYEKVTNVHSALCIRSKNRLSEYFVKQIFWQKTKTNLYDLMVF